jgi:hypothetical protein
MLETFSRRTFSAALSSGSQVSHDVYTKGDSGACVVIIQELPGIGADPISLANPFTGRLQA